MIDGMERRLSRRRLLSGAAALGAVPLAAACEPKATVQAETWDRTVDVVVIGSGTGLTAAVTAAAAGLKVLVLEKSDIVGGNSVVSGGILWVPNNRIMERIGLKDSRDGALDYLRHLAQGQAEEEVLTTVVDRGPEMLEALEKTTPIRWIALGNARKTDDYHPTWKGSVPGRSVIIDGQQNSQTFNGGAALIAALQEAAEAKGAEILTETPALRLIAKAGAGGTAVVGVEAQHAGKPLRIRATRGVLVAAGGFERNWEMKRHFLRGPSPYTLGSETNTGDGIRMGMALGADLRNMNEAWGMTVYKAEGEENGAVRAGISLFAQIERSHQGCITVNRRGERFTNEGSDYDSAWRMFHAWENWLEEGYANLPAFHIFDQQCRDTLSIAGRTKEQPLPAWVVSAATLDELAGRLGIDTAGLKATVARFNEGAAAGQDPDFHRGESPYDTGGSPFAAEPNNHPTLAPLGKGPYYAAEVAPGDLGTCGGLRVNGRAEVVDVFGKAIRGLYASGNSAGVGGPGTGYGGYGGTLGPAMTFAYVAAVEMVAAAPRQVT